MSDQLIKYAATFEKSARRFPGFRPLRHAPELMQELAKVILRTNKPLGAATPFTYQGQDYLAEFARHSNAPKGITVHQKIEQPTGAPQLSERTQRQLNQLDPKFRVMVEALFAQAYRAYENGELPYLPEVAEAFRSQDRQEELADQGITPTRKSQHTNRLAVDLMARDEKGKAFYPKGEQQFYAPLARMAKQLGFQWGGDFRKHDPGHFQYPQGGYVPRPELQQPSISTPTPAPVPSKPKPSTMQQIVNRQYPRLMQTLMG